MILINYLISSCKKAQNYLIVCIVIFLLSFICGICFCKQLCDNYIIVNINDYNVFFDKNVTLSSYFFSKFFVSIGLITIVGISGLVIYLLPIHCLIFMYNGLILGCIATSLFECYSVVGLTVFLLVIFPSFLLRIVSIILLSALNFLTISRSNKCEKLNLQQYLTNLLIAIVIALVGLLWEIIILGFIIRPVNIYF